MSIKIKKSDIQLCGSEKSSYGYFYPRELYYKGIKCRKIATHSRRVFLYKVDELVFKVGDNEQNKCDLRNWKIICKKYPEYCQYFVPSYKVVCKDDFTICVQKYVKHIKRLNKDAQEVLDRLKKKLTLCDVGHYCGHSYNCGVDLKTRQLIIYDLGIEAIY